MKFRFLWFVLLLVACRGPEEAAPTSVPADPGFTGTRTAPVARTETTIKGRLLYVQQGQMWVHSGTRARQLNVEGTVTDGAWSRDGTKVAYVRRGESFSDLWLFDVNTNEATQVTFNEGQAAPRSRDFVHQAIWAVQPTWSPDDEELLFLSQVSPATPDGAPNPIYEYPLSLYRYDLALVGKRQPTNADQVAVDTGNDLQNPEWSPDGESVVYVEAPRGSGERRIMRLSFTNQASEPVPGVPNGAYDPAWSPDGWFLAFAATDGGATDVWVVPAGGGNPQRITDTGRARAPTWSPDGSQIAFIEVGDQSTDVQVVGVVRDGSTVSGSKPTPVASGQIDANAGLSWTQ